MSEKKVYMEMFIRFPTLSNIDYKNNQNHCVSDYSNKEK